MSPGSYDHRSVRLEEIRLELVTERAAAARDRAREVEVEVAALRVTRASPGGEVEVTVDGAGRLVDARFSDRARGTERLGDHLLATLRRAEAALPDLVADIVAPDGASDTARALVDGYRRRFPPVEEPTHGRRPPSEGETTWLR